MQFMKYFPILPADPSGSENRTGKGQKPLGDSLTTRDQSPVEKELRELHKDFVSQSTPHPQSEHKQTQAHIRENVLKGFRGLQPPP